MVNKSNITIISGLQWGDEGKGKTSFYLSKDVDYVAKVSGSSNAEHTFYREKKIFRFRLLPTGILAGKKALITEGVSISPRIISEINNVKKEYPDINKRLFISSNSHVIFPYHQILDKRDGEEIETIGEGNGPVNSDKVNRIGITLQQLVTKRYYKQLKRNYRYYQNILGDYGNELPDINEIIRTYDIIGKQLKEFITNTQSIIIKDIYQNKKKLLIEGTQGMLLDNLYGTYPFSTSMSTFLHSILYYSYLPIDVNYYHIGVCKAYQTRYSKGPFPTEQTNSIGKLLREKGNEFAAEGGFDEGKPIRCGYLDLMLLKYAIYFNNIQDLVLTKLDVLSYLDKIRICVGYKFNGRKITNVKDFDMTKIKYYKPEYIILPGWKKRIEDCNIIDDLPKQVKLLIKYIEKNINKPIKYISISPYNKMIINNY